MACLVLFWPLIAAGADDLMERGSYLTRDVAMCVQCHSPRRSDGSLIETRLFRGGDVPVAPPAWQPRWAWLAPDLISLAREDPGRIRSVLQTGKRPDGTKPRPPMPSFRFSADDANVVLEYLRAQGGR